MQRAHKACCAAAYPTAGEIGRVPTRVTRHSFTIVSPRCCQPAVLCIASNGFANGRVMNARLAISFFFVSLSLIFFPSKSTGCGAHPNFPDRYCAPRYESARSPRGNRVSRDGLEFFRERERGERERESSGTSIWRIFERRVESVSLRARWMRFVKRDNPEGDFVLRNCIGEKRREGVRGEPFVPFF